MVSLLQLYCYALLLAVAAARILHLLYLRTIKPKPEAEATAVHVGLLPPGPAGLPVLGNLLQMVKADPAKPNQYLAELSAIYGPLMRLRLGCKTLIIASSADMAMQVLRIHDRDLAGRDPFLTAMINNLHHSSLIFGQPWQHWRTLRRLATAHVFSPEKLKLHSAISLRRWHLRSAVSRIFAAGKSAPVGVRDVAFWWSLTLLGKIVYGGPVFWNNNEEEENCAEVREFGEILANYAARGSSPNVADFLPALKWMDPQGIVRDCSRYAHRFLSVIDKWIHERLLQQQQGETPDDEGPSTCSSSLLDVLLNLGDSSHMSLVDTKVLTGELMMAGTDTTSTTLEWAIAELIRNPRVMKKAQQEIDKVVGHERLVEEKDMADLPYLRAIVKETLRLHPAAPLLVPHRAERDCMIGDFLVPKGAQVIVNYWAIARDAGVWEEPLKFRPERFLHTNLDFKGQNYEFIPFGSGRRMCVGMPLANIMIHSFLAALIQGFDWACIDTDDEVDMDYRVALTMHKARQLVAKATPRLDSTFYQSLTVTTDPN